MTHPAAGQIWSATDYAHHAGFVPALGHDVLAMLAAQPGERILDLGCGDGVLTRRITDADVTGLEPDPALAAAATARGIRVIQQDAHDPIPHGPYDAIFSNAALHWMRDPARVFANAFAALRPGGRFVAEQGGFGNVAAVVTALNAALLAAGHATQSPWDFPSPTRQRKRLERAGFTLQSITLIPRPTPLPTGIAGWLQTFAGPFVSAFPEQDRAAIVKDTVTRMTALHDPDEGWIADYVRLRFHATKPG
jgi:SAM-dependent methyltransferase